MPYAAQRAVVLVAKFTLARPYKQAFRSDRELLFSMNSLQSAQLVLLKCIAQRRMKTNVSKGHACAMKYIFSMSLHILYVTIVNMRCPNVRKAIQDF